MYLLKLEKGRCFFRWWAETTGYWFSVYIGILPWIFSLFQLTLDPSGLGGIVSSDFGTNAIFLTVGNASMWIIQSLIHIYYVPMLEEQIYCENIHII